MAFTFDFNPKHARIQSPLLQTIDAKTCRNKAHQEDGTTATIFIDMYIVYNGRSGLQVKVRYAEVTDCVVCLCMYLAMFVCVCVSVCVC